MNGLRNVPHAHGQPRVLTSRQKQVAILVAKGLTNREIATTLVISDRTAANHVQHIMYKLGFKSRAQIAAWVVSVGLLTFPPERASSGHGLPAQASGESPEAE